MHSQTTPTSGSNEVCYSLGGDKLVLPIEGLGNHFEYVFVLTVNTVGRETSKVVMPALRDGQLLYAKTTPPWCHLIRCAMLKCLSRHGRSTLEIVLGVIERVGGSKGSRQYELF